jgi:hypothetical protein
LQIQVDLLEQNPDCMMCAHQSTINNEKDNIQEIQVLKRNVLQLETNATCKYDIYNAPYCHTSSRMYKNILPKDSLSTLKFITWDITLFYWYLDKGKMIFINRNMSIYNITGKGVWSKLDEKQKFMQNAKTYFELDLYFDYKYHKIFEPIYLPINKKYYVNIRIPISKKKTLCFCIKREKKKTI